MRRYGIDCGDGIVVAVCLEARPSKKTREALIAVGRAAFTQQPQRPEATCASPDLRPEDQPEHDNSENDGRNPAGNGDHEGR